VTFVGRYYLDSIAAVTLRCLTNRCFALRVQRARNG
jgi:hypothetical protein